MEVDDLYDLLTRMHALALQTVARSSVLFEGDAGGRNRREAGVTVLSVAGPLLALGTVAFY